MISRKENNRAKYAATENQREFVAGNAAIIFRVFLSDPANCGSILRLSSASGEQTVLDEKRWPICTAESRYRRFFVDGRSANAELPRGGRRGQRKRERGTETERERCCFKCFRMFTPYRVARPRGIHTRVITSPVTTIELSASELRESAAERRGRKYLVKHAANGVPTLNEIKSLTKPNACANVRAERNDSRLPTRLSYLPRPFTPSLDPRRSFWRILKTDDNREQI